MKDYNKPNYSIEFISVEDTILTSFVVNETAHDIGDKNNIFDDVL